MKMKIIMARIPMRLSASLDFIREIIMIIIMNV